MASTKGKAPPVKTRAELLKEVQALAEEANTAGVAAARADKAHTRALWSLGDWLVENVEIKSTANYDSPAYMGLLTIRDVTRVTPYSKERLIGIRAVAGFWPLDQRSSHDSFSRHTTAMQQSHRDLDVAIKWFTHNPVRTYWSRERMSTPKSSIAHTNGTVDIEGAKEHIKKKATKQQKAQLAVALLEDDKVARAVQKAVDKRHAARRASERAARKAEDEAALEATYTERDKAVMGRNGSKAQAEAQAQEATRRDEPDNNAVYTDENGDVYNHDYVKDDPDSPFIRTAEGSLVNWHNEMACETQTPRDIIDGIERSIENIKGPAYTLGATDKNRLEAVLNKGLEGL